MILDAGLELLLKYRPALYAQGRVSFDAPPPAMVALGVGGAVVAALVVWTYRHAAAGRSARERATLTALRLAALGLLVACLMRPVLVLSASVPRRNTVAVLVDDSRSMRVRDWDGRPRADFPRDALGTGSPLLRALGEQFAVRLYRFSDVAAPVDSVRALGFAGERTRIGAALDRVRADLEGVPLAGVVVVTDGADGSPLALADAARAMRARATPVFTVGVGSETSPRDVEVRRIEAPRSVLRGSTVSVDVVLAHHGLAGVTVPVIAEVDGRIVARRDVALPSGGDALDVRLAVPAPDPGAHHLTVRVPLQSGEPVPENNERVALLDVRDGRDKVLYFEGEPRFEMKFVRRAVADDQGLRLVVLQRTAEGKYLRLGVDDSLDLRSGFPTTRDELFAYRAIVLGSVEASAFTADQLRMLADFVSLRGGSILLLGGRRAFAEGGYAGTPLEEAMPVLLDAPIVAKGQEPPVAEVAVQLTPAGAAHVPLQLASTDTASLARWRTLPPLTAVNVIRRAKPGATVLLTGDTKDGGPRIVLAYHRYGRGKVAAMPVQDTWLWQMHASIPVEDMTHELFWRQTLRWLTADVPAPVEVAVSTERPAPGEAVTLNAAVRDSHFVAINGATVVAHVATPSGARVDVPLEWNVQRDGEYRGTFVPAEAGVYEVRVARDSGLGTRGSGTPMPSDPRVPSPDPRLDGVLLHIEASPSREEYFESAMRAPLLRTLAAETGGRFYTPATVGALPEDLRYARAGVTVTERKELWDLPVTFVLLAGLLGAEWGYRRHLGLA